jgi:hypothetical protein
MSLGEDGKEGREHGQGGSPRHIHLGSPDCPIRWMVCDDYARVSDVRYVIELLCSLLFLNVLEMLSDAVGEKESVAPWL